jgi:uncharacterized protein (AIM24 family)
MGQPAAPIISHGDDPLVAVELEGDERVDVQSRALAAIEAASGG